MGKAILEPQTLTLRAILLAILVYFVWFTLAQIFLLRKKSHEKADE